MLVAKLQINEKFTQQYQYTKFLTHECNILISECLTGSFNLWNIKRLILRSCSMLRTLFSPSTAMHLTSLEELMIAECHELIYLVSYGISHENKDEIIQEDHDSQSYDAIFPRLKSISVVNCNLLVYLFHVSYVQGLVNLRDIEIRQTHSLIYVFGHGLMYHNKIQTELPVLEKVALFSIPNMINIFPENYYINCPSLLRIVMEDVGLSTLSVNNLMGSSASTEVQFCLLPYSFILILGVIIRVLLTTPPGALVKESPNRNFVLEI
jgi:hypothetical protein